MAPTGKGKRKILFVAEAPGETEDRRGVQLVGKAGKLLREVIQDLGFDLEDCWKTNCVICRPPRNQIQPSHIQACRPNLLRTLAELKPVVVVLLGTSAVNSLLSPEWNRSLGPLGKWLGWTIPSPTYQAWICPTYHPSYIVRSDEDPVLKRILKEHLARAFQLERAGRPNPVPLRALSEQIEIIKDSRHARSRLRSLASSKGLLAFDYETTGLKPEDARHRILSSSFCHEGKTFACLIDERAHKPLRRILQNEKLLKIASNIKFEERWSMAKVGCKVEGWHWDTMLATHVLNNYPGICSIKFQAFVRLGISDYDKRIGSYMQATGGNGFNRLAQADPDELLLYNGLDSLIEYQVALQQMEEMNALETS